MVFSSLYAFQSFWAISSQLHDKVISWLSRPIFNIGSFLLVFFGLYVVFGLINKILGWSSREAGILGKKMEPLAWCFIITFSAWWLLLDLPLDTVQPITLKVLWSLSLFFFAILILDLLNYLFFEIYYPRVWNTRGPQIISNLIRGIYFITLILFVLANVFKIDIKPFLTGSAILTAIIGLALQDTLGNLFSGLALHMSKPFDVGDWIKIDKIDGMVVKIEWRATTIRTREMDYITLPNNQLSKTDLINYSQPTKIHADYVEVGVRYRYPPGMIKRLLKECAFMTEGVNKNMEPEVFLIRYNEFSVDYRMKYFIEDHAIMNNIKSSVMEKIWYIFRRNNVEIPFPIRDVYIRKDGTEENNEQLVEILSGIDFLSGLKNAELTDLSGRIREEIYSEGETVIRQGDMGDRFFIIKQGRVQIEAVDEQGEKVFIKESGAEDFFGEISVLTGEPRTATVTAMEDTFLFSLGKDDFKELLSKYPDMDTKLSEKLAERKKYSFEQMEMARSAANEREAREKAEKKVDSLQKQILKNIRKFFSM